jgi:hypothetical protein
MVWRAWLLLRQPAGLRYSGIRRTLDVPPARFLRRLRNLDRSFYHPRRYGSDSAGNRPPAAPVSSYFRRRVSGICGGMDGRVFYYSWDGWRMGWVSCRVCLDGPGPGCGFGRSASCAQAPRRVVHRQFRRLFSRCGALLFNPRENRDAALWGCLRAVPGSRVGRRFMPGSGVRERRGRVTVTRDGSVPVLSRAAADFGHVRSQALVQSGPAAGWVPGCWTGPDFSRREGFRYFSLAVIASLSSSSPPRIAA